MTILNRLRSAESGSRELDAMIAVSLQIMPSNAFQPCASSDAGTFGTGAHTFWRTPEYTTSIDAALALVERMLPESNCVGFDKTPLRVDAYVSRNNVSSGHWCEDGWHKSSAPLAILCALFAKLKKNATL